MRISSADRSAMLTGAVYRYAESLFRTRMITGVRNVKERQIEDKKEEMRQLIGILYRVLAVSSDSIMILIKCTRILCRNYQPIQSAMKRDAPQSLVANSFPSGW
ncbi:hypothetical protein Nepgr_012182 [Nepenthes gracilis]|uniref:Uncharacterized protein n=1 Tax=Nepenthes gracilis TaxID=150966 RepID=A0AAD3SGI7_NEPGR|nr:hypothetical protein Nepgr_012182 [Nepenthes gracilis]